MASMRVPYSVSYGTEIGVMACQGLDERRLRTCPTRSTRAARVVSYNRPEDCRGLVRVSSRAS